MQTVYWKWRRFFIHIVMWRCLITHSDKATTSVSFGRILISNDETFTSHMCAHTYKIAWWMHELMTGRHSINFRWGNNKVSTSNLLIRMEWKMLTNRIKFIHFEWMNWKWRWIWSRVCRFWHGMCVCARFNFMTSHDITLQTEYIGVMLTQFWAVKMLL